MNGVVPASETGQQDSVQVQLEDGDGYVDEEFVRGGLGGDVREYGGITIHVTNGGEVCEVFHLDGRGTINIGEKMGGGEGGG